MEMTLEQLSSKVLDQPVKNRAILAKKLLDSLDLLSNLPKKMNGFGLRRPNGAFKRLRKAKRSPNQRAR